MLSKSQSSGLQFCGNRILIWSIVSSGLRKTMLRAHRQAWCWQDEYFGLTIDDIRELERQTQAALQEKMAQALAEENGEVAPASKTNSPTKEQVAHPPFAFSVVPLSLHMRGGEKIQPWFTMLFHLSLSCKQL